jgi:hypothetical protein
MPALVRAFFPGRFSRGSVRRSFALALLVALATMLLAPPADAQSKTYRIRHKPAAGTVIKKTPLLFYVAKSDGDACGKGCSEWIAVEGNFDSGAANRFRAFLKRNGARALPVIFHSPGGEVTNAFAIGRFMRGQGMSASVGRTVPEACVAGEGDACRQAKSSGKPVPARLVTAHGQCSSACVWALLGAKVRQVPPGTFLGVHSHRQELTVTVRASPAVSEARIRAYAKERFQAYAKTARAISNEKTRAYIAEMGVAPELFTLASSVPHETVRFLTREEIARFGIDTRSFAESPWSLVEPPSQRAFLIKSIAESRAPTGKSFRAQHSGADLRCRFGCNAYLWA